LSGCYADVQTRMKREKLIHGMLDHADEILPGLYLGSIEAMLGFHNMPIAQRSEWRIISLLSDTDMFGVTTPLFLSKHVLFRVEDRRSQDLSGVFDKCADEITRAFARGKKVLVHCVAGISRSPSAVAAYLIKNKGMELPRTSSVCAPEINLWQWMLTPHTYSGHALTASHWHWRACDLEDLGVVLDPDQPRPLHGLTC
jgi:hypothetical protein